MDADTLVFVLAASFFELGTEAMVGLRGEVWHLNVLCATLRDVVVEKVIFRDLGTVSAPVLAAVTLQKERRVK